MSPNVRAVLDSLAFKKRHTRDCQQRNRVTEWEQLSDNRKRCACIYWSCGVHDRAERFKRKSTGETSLERAKAVVTLRIESGHHTATFPDVGIPISEAIGDFMEFTTQGGATESTMAKYQTLMDQIQAFAEWKGFRYLHELSTQNAMIEFRKALEDENAGYKRGREKKEGVPLWRKNSVETCRRHKKILSHFFRRCISRHWISEDPTHILRFPKARTSKKKKEVKYLDENQFSAVIRTCEGFPRMPEYNKLRLKALILTMRWTGLRISDAVLLTEQQVAGDVLRVRTKKASTPVQVPLHPELVAVLAKMQLYEGGLYFWNRRSSDSSPATAQHNFGKQIAEVFARAGVKSDARHISHALRNTFAVDLLERGLPLETVSLMLGHQSVTTTERYYADFSQGYMDRAEAQVRKVWLLTPDSKIA